MSPSSYHWINYDEDKLARRYIKHKAAVRGTALHQLAHDSIKLGVKIDSSNPTLSAYVNDVIDAGLNVEQPLYFSENCFGHADAIGFDFSILSIWDYKSGDIPASENQLHVYAAIFCLEYNVSPFDIKFDLRIYQNGEVVLFETDPALIANIMDKIVAFDRYITELDRGDFYED